MSFFLSEKISKGDEEDDDLQRLQALRRSFNSIKSVLDEFTENQQDEMLITAADKRRIILREELARNDCKIAFYVHTKKKYAVGKH